MTTDQRLEQLDSLYTQAERYDPHTAPTPDRTHNPHLC